MKSLPRVGQIVYDRMDLPVKVTGYLKFTDSYEFRDAEESDANGITGMDEHDTRVYLRLNEISERKVG